MTLDYLRRYRAYRQYLIDAMSYEDYLQSPEWKDTRRRALVKSGYRCERCGSKTKLHVHHKTYEHKGRELPGDLSVLCKRCHEAEHGLLTTAE